MEVEDDSPPTFEEELERIRSIPLHKIVRLRNYNLTDEDVLSLLEALKKNPRVESIDLSDNCFTEVGLIPLLMYISTNSKLKMLDLSDNELCGDSLVAVADMLCKSSLGVLKLNRVGLSSNHIVHLESIRQGTLLQSLSVSGNEMGDVGVRQLLMLLTGSQGVSESLMMSELDLSFNSLTDNAVMYLAGFLEDCESLERVDMRGNELSAELCEELKEKSECNIEYTVMNDDTSSMDPMQDQMKNVYCLLMDLLTLIHHSNPDSKLEILNSEFPDLVSPNTLDSLLHSPSLITNQIQSLTSVFAGQGSLYFCSGVFGFREGLANIVIDNFHIIHAFLVTQPVCVFESFTHSLPLPTPTHSLTHSPSRCGRAKIEMIVMIELMMKMDDVCVSEKMVESGVAKTIWDLSFSCQWNTYLWTSLTHLLTEVFSLPERNEKLIHFWLVDCELPKRLTGAINNAQEKINNIRCSECGCLGFIIQICQQLIKLCDSRSPVAVMVNNLLTSDSEWMKCVRGPMIAITDRDKILLADKVPPRYLGGMEEFEDCSSVGFFNFLMSRPEDGEQEESEKESNIEDILLSQVDEQD